MRLLLTLFLLLTVFVNRAQKKNVSKYHIDNIITPNSNEIKFRRMDSLFKLEWLHGGKPETLDYKFSFNTPLEQRPRFVAENSDYVMLLASVGHRRWTAFFLPLKKGGHSSVVNDYLAVDLEQYLVARMENDRLRIYNFKEDKSQVFKLRKCQSEFYGNCIDTIYFKKRELIIKWKSSKTKPAKLKLKV